MSDSICDKVKDIVLNGYLECSVCLEFAVCPIYNCNNGHILCGICKDKTSNCPKCRTNLTVSPILERILKSEEVTLSCRYNEHGCTSKIKPHEMKEHLISSCDFRPIKCVQNGDWCKKEIYNPNDLFKHWKDIHKMSELNAISTIDLLEESRQATISRMFSLTETGYKTALMKPIGWSSQYFQFDNQTFYCHCHGKGGNIHSWITMLGHEIDANKYIYSAILSSENSISKTKQIIFREIPVHCLQYYDLEKVEALGHTAAISCNTMKLLHDKKQA